ADLATRAGGTAWRDDAHRRPAFLAGAGTEAGVPRNPLRLNGSIRIVSKRKACSKRLLWKVRPWKAVVIFPGANATPASLRQMERRSGMIAKVRVCWAF